MHLNHINLAVGDVSKGVTLFTHHFDFEIVQEGKVPQAGGPIQAGSQFAMLRGRDGFSLILTELSDATPSSYPKDFHLGFMLDQPEIVRAKHHALEAAGYAPRELKSFQAMGRDWTAFYCPLGNGVEIEVNASVVSDDHT